MGQADSIRFCDECGASLTAAEGRMVDDRLLCKRCTPRFLRLRAAWDYLRAWCRERWLVAVMALILMGLVCALASTIKRTSALESKVGKLEYGIEYVASELDSKVDELEFKVEELDSKVDKVESSVNYLETKVRQ